MGTLIAPHGSFNLIDSENSIKHGLPLFLPILLVKKGILREVGSYLLLFALYQYLYVRLFEYKFLKLELDETLVNVLLIGLLYDP
jgi:hypothetical protein